MSVNSITGDVTAYTLQSMNTAGSVDKSVKGTSLAPDQSSSQTVQLNAVVANANKISSANKQSQSESSGSDKNPVRAMSHVVESYNLHGKVRTKFMDSKNNVIYQIPSEMVAKMEDQMMKPETSTDVKG